MNYKWQTPGKAVDSIDVLRYIAKERQMNNQQIKEFVTSFTQPHDPFLFQHMEAVVNKIMDHINKNNKILIYGDYDCDGVTSTYTLFTGLKYLNANVIYKLPHRLHDGYGLKKHIIDYAKEQNVDLIITVDNGIAAIDAIKYSIELGIDIIVTDHHQPQKELPPCLIINPNVPDTYPFNGLCGCGVAFKVVSALIPNIKETDIYSSLLEITAIGTIGDSMVMLDENRTFVFQGLRRLRRTTNYGLKELFNVMKLTDKDITVDDVGFSLAPCINAAGRLDSPTIALDLLLCDDDVESKVLASKLKSLNETRKDMQKEAVDKIEIEDPNQCIVEVIDGKYAGIGGIVAAKLVELYKRPCFVFHNSDKKDTIAGSGRTFGDFDLMQCVVNYPEIATGGGHKSACGVSIKKDDIGKFREACTMEFDKWLEVNPDGMLPTLYSTCEMDFSSISMKLIQNIDRLKPFGNGNEQPIFVSKDITVCNARIVGKNKNVLQCNFEQKGISFKAVGFENIKNKFTELGNPQNVDIMYQLGVNEFPAGTFTIQLNIIDIIEHSRYYID